MPEPHAQQETGEKSYCDLDRVRPGRENIAFREETDPARVSRERRGTGAIMASGRNGHSMPKPFPFQVIEPAIRQRTGRRIA